VAGAFAGGLEFAQRLVLGRSQQCLCRALSRNPGECLALEDSPTGAIAALTAGLYLIGVPSATDLLFPAHQHAATLNDPALWQTLGLAPSALSA
jgi:beta-phosphoglucomutase-like phosphatase (HAD superfamily)